jgi:outer membrane protein TolC
METSPILAQSEPVAPAPAQTPASAQPLTLTDCLSIALERQPALAGHRSSVAAAEAQKRGLDELHFAALVSREIPIRRRQACLGVTVAAAGLEQAQHETVYAVTRTYLSVLYAQAQEAVALEVITRLKDSRQNAERLSKAGNPDFVVTKSDVDKLTVYIALAEVRHIEASQGTQRALAALREAMGVPPDHPLTIAPGKIPFARRDLNREELIALSLARRGELVQATTVAEVTDLEVEAQATSFHLTMRTFAAVVDIHARQIPQGVSNGEYRPGALGLEMPTVLAGKRDARLERARDLRDRATAVIDKTRGLIALEAEDAYLKWQESARKVATLEKTPALAVKLADNLQERFREKGNVPAQDAVQAYVVASQAQAQFNEAVYQHALALAALERITAGGIAAGFVSSLPAPR